MAHRDKQKAREYQRDWYHANRDARRESRTRNRLRVLDWFEELRATLVCERCAETHPACLSFHHRDSRTKEFAISVAVKKGWGIGRILREIQKCAVLCHNCHGKHHWGEKEKRERVPVPPRLRGRSKYVMDA